jgi:oligoendopeptidase F
LNDVFTMMHELGHAIHSIFSSKQPNMLSHASLPLAETASTFSETILMHRLLNESKDRDEKIALLVETIDSHYKSIIRQAYFVIFEEWAHEKIKDGVTKDEISAYYRSLLVEQFGGMDIPEIFNTEWVYIPHIFYTPFYCYAYVWGHMLSLSFYAMYKEQGQKFVDKYVEFLSSGSSKSTLDIMLAIGADPRSVAFWQKGFDVVKADVEELKRLVLEK